MDETARSPGEAFAGEVAGADALFNALPSDLQTFFQEMGIGYKNLAQYPNMAEALAIVKAAQEKLAATDNHAAQEEYDIALTSLCELIDLRYGTQPYDDVGGEEPLAPRGVEHGREEDSQE